MVSRRGESEGHSSFRARTPCFRPRPVRGSTHLKGLEFTLRAQRRPQTDAKKKNVLFPAFLPSATLPEFSRHSPLKLREAGIITIERDPFAAGFDCQCGKPCIRH